MSDFDSHILVPTDPRLASPAACRMAAKLARQSDSLVTLLHVHPSGNDSSSFQGLDAMGYLHQVLWLPPDDATHTPTVKRASKSRGLKLLEGVREEVLACGKSDVQVRSVWRQGNLLREIFAFVEESGVDTIVLGSSDQGWWPLTLRQKLIKRAPCEVVLVHNSR